MWELLRTMNGGQPGRTGSRMRDRQYQAAHFTCANTATVAGSGEDSLGELS